MSQLRSGMNKMEVEYYLRRPINVLTVNYTQNGVQEVLAYRNNYDEVYAVEFWDDYLTGYEYLYDDRPYIAPSPPMILPPAGRPIIVAPGRDRPSRPNRPSRPSRPSRPDNNNNNTTNGRTSSGRYGNPNSTTDKSPGTSTNTSKDNNNGRTSSGRTSTNQNNNSKPTSNNNKDYTTSGRTSGGRYGNQSSKTEKPTTTTTTSTSRDTNSGRTSSDQSSSSRRSK